MKRIGVCLLLGFLLAGCAASPVFEPVEDVYGGTEPAPCELRVSLPEDAAVLTAAEDGRNALYFCDGYTVTTQVLDGGDLDRSLRSLTGYGSAELTVLETLRDGFRCVNCVWTSAGEGGDQVGRLVLLDDGAYHYAVTAMAPAEKAGELTRVWEELLSGVSLLNTEP